MEGGQLRLAAAAAPRVKLWETYRAARIAARRYIAAAPESRPRSTLVHHGGLPTGIKLKLGFGFQLA